MRFSTGLLLALSLPPLAFAQTETPREATPVVLLPDLGSHHHPIATKVPEAQRFFDQSPLWLLISQCLRDHSKPASQGHFKTGQR